MARSLLYLSSIVLSIVYMMSCSKASEDLLMPPQCDTAGMKYSTDVLPIITTNCYGCHGNGNVTQGVDLDGYDNLKARVDNGDLIGTITHANGYPAMPYNGAKLSDCDINKIKAWIANGALEN